MILVLNRLGGAASLDSLNRHMCAVALQRKAKGLLRDINSRAFTIASMDNIDFLQSHASVYAGTQHRSWHGTSIQVVQPQPHKLQAVGDSRSGSSLLPMFSESDPRAGVVSTDLMPVVEGQIAKRTQRSSPIDSPSKVTHSPYPKRLKKARTFSEAIKLNEVSSGDDSGSLRLCGFGFSSTRALCLSDFIVSEKEDSVLAGIKESALIYSVQKSCLKPDNDFKHHIAAMSNSEHMEASTVTYSSIIDMHADTLEAMSQVASGSTLISLQPNILL